MTPEGRITRDILKHLRMRGGWWVKVHGSASQQAGIPDIIGCYKGYFIALEVKTPETIKNTSSIQRLNIERIQNAGGIPEVVTSAQAALDVTDAIDEYYLNSEEE